MCLEEEDVFACCLEKEEENMTRLFESTKPLVCRLSIISTRLGPDLIYGPDLVTSRSLSKNQKRDDSILQNAFHDLLQITPHIFKETVEGDLRFKKNCSE